MTERWRIHLSDAAERDFQHILETTLETFGERQLEVYRLTLVEALAALEAGPNISGSKARGEILPDLRTLHVARKGRRGRHLILYRAAAGNIIQVSRILHECMELARHLPPEAE
ncbi:type II toxin-antitoxin system RelE/ParE family toxin [Methylocystis bryophila]|uniref:Plasmid stabilization protein ParE n=1 Tax=Methylocystis bryophila TaxID=655015 RepID=A0A1W6MRS4_9HYPH|nr:type II toxin-antitoxin system RelE/ParE family toxin [Methylocystis bryophila]ARN80294.1 plasmid stabilization protein ParE [Methylocystis bryophila]BDV40265.1 plasmid stabilization protein ParE [Methylocystis bryophila]